MSMSEPGLDREEDLLEVLLESPALDRTALGDRLGLDPTTFARVLDAAAGRGWIDYGPTGQAGLSREGRRVARRIARRHRTLACFFEELGMARDAANREACTLEHGVSDEAIARLADHLRCPAPSDRPCEGAGGDGRPLLDYGEGERVCITVVRPCGRYRRLMDMGVVPGEEVVVRRRLSNRAVVIEVKGCELGLSPECAATVLAAPCP